MPSYIDYVVSELYKMSTKGMADFISTDELQTDIVSGDKLNNVIDNSRYTIDFIKATEHGALNSIKKLVSDRTGKVTIELYDNLEILTLLAKFSEQGNNSKVNLDDISLEDIIKESKKKLLTPELSNNND